MPRIRPSVAATVRLHTVVDHGTQLNMKAENTACLSGVDNECGVGSIYVKFQNSQIIFEDRMVN